MGRTTVRGAIRPRAPAWRGFTLSWRGDLADAEEHLRNSFDEADRWGTGPDTLQWYGANLGVTLVELIVFIPFAITLLIGIGFYIAGRETRRRLAPASLPPNVQPAG